MKKIFTALVVVFILIAVGYMGTKLYPHTHFSWNSTYFTSDASGYKLHEHNTGPSLQMRFGDMIREHDNTSRAAFTKEHGSEK